MFRKYESLPEPEPRIETEVEERPEPELYLDQMVGYSNDASMETQLEEEESSQHIDDNLSSGFYVIDETNSSFVQMENLSINDRDNRINERSPEINHSNFQPIEIVQMESLPINLPTDNRIYEIALESNHSQQNQAQRVPSISSEPQATQTQRAPSILSERTEPQALRPPRGQLSILSEPQAQRPADDEQTQNEPIENPPVQPIQASRLRQAMFESAHQTFTHILETVESIREARSEAHTSSIAVAQNHFIQFMVSRLPTLTGEQQSEFIDEILELYLKIKNNNLN